MILLIKNNIYKILLGTFISLVCLFLLFKIVDSFDKTLESLTSVSIFYLTIGFLIYFLSLFLRTYRWKILLKNNIGTIKFKSLLNVVIFLSILYSFNNLEERTELSANIYFDNFNTSKLLSVMSFRLPIGVETIYKVPDILLYYLVYSC